MKNVLRWLKSLLSMVFHFRRWMRRRTSSLKDDDNKVDEYGQKASLYLQYYYLNKIMLEKGIDSNNLTLKDVKEILTTLNCLNNNGKESDNDDRQSNSTS